MSEKILACATAIPPYRHAAASIEPHLRRWLATRDPELWRRAERVIAAAGIGARASALPLDEVFARRSFEEKNNCYVESALALAAQAFEAALARAAIKPRQIDFLITTSCTGFMIPSVDAYLVNQFAMRQDVQRLPILQMGCAGGTAGLISATDYLRANPGSTVALIAVELPSLTLQLDDFAMANIVSAALFADGAACVILGPGTGVRPVIRAKQMYHLPDTTDLMGFQLTNAGLRIVLDKGVPAAIAAHLERMLLPFLARQGATLESIEHYLLHPGSIKILAKTAELLARHGKHVDDSFAVLRSFGNMSSATVLFILERFLARDIRVGERGLMMSFGPGFAGHMLLLEWEGVERRQ
ncbi:MAG: type III polyketide synthase [Planctomycetota bacterium]